MSDARAPGRWVVTRVALVTLLSVASLLVPELGLLAGLLTLIFFLSMPAVAGRARALLAALAVSAVLSSVGIVRFVVARAAPGVVMGGQTKTARHAVSHLREVLFGQDAMRKLAVVDPDGDGVGSAVLLGQMAGGIALPEGASMERPVLHPRWNTRVSTRIGPAARVSGYLFVVCLPKAGGGFTAQPGEPVDVEAAERRFLAYAWPDHDTRGIHEAYFIDEHERILVNENRENDQTIYASPNFPPPCDDALENDAWRPWREKQPRTTLPGAG